MLIDSFGNLLFGKHEGENLRDVATGYLQWMLRSMETLDARERAKVSLELVTRGVKLDDRGNQYSRAHNRPPFDTSTPKIPAGIEPQVILEIISAGRQTLAKRYHPDAGGDHERMVAVNRTADFLEQQTRELQGANH